MTELTLRKIQNSKNLEKTRFLDLYQRLILGDKTLKDVEMYSLFKVAVIFLCSKDQNLERLGYRIVLRYSNIFGDYLPLYEIALSRNFIPITKFIEKHHPESLDIKENFSNVYVDAYQEGFKDKVDERVIYRSLAQLELSDFSDKNENIAVVAPTSYGKSEMMIKKIETSKKESICVIVPSKALLAQTKRSLLKREPIRKKYRKIITHPDMYKAEDKPFLAVLTQERLHILFRKHKSLAIDLILVDEAHNILEDESRAHLGCVSFLGVKRSGRNMVLFKDTIPFTRSYAREEYTSVPSGLGKAENGFKGQRPFGSRFDAEVGRRGSQSPGNGSFEYPNAQGTR